EAHGVPGQPAPRGAYPSCRARHGCRLRARGPDLRPRLWPHHRDGKGERHPERSRSASGLSRRCRVSLLKLEGVESFYGASQALFGVSLEVKQGEVVALMGRNGMGKTTTIRSIFGLVRVRTGSIRFENRDIAGM